MTSREDSAPEVVAASSAMMGRIPVEGEVAEEVSAKYLGDTRSMSIGTNDWRSLGSRIHSKEFLLK